MRFYKSIDGYTAFDGTGNLILSKNKNCFDIDLGTVKEKFYFEGFYFINFFQCNLWSRVKKACVVWAWIVFERKIFK